METSNQPNSDRSIQNTNALNLEAAGGQYQLFEIFYNNENGIETRVESPILETYRIGDVEYLQLRDRVIRMDDVLSAKIQHPVSTTTPHSPSISTAQQILIGETPYYRMIVDKNKNRIYLTIFKAWRSKEDIVDVSDHFNRLVENLDSPFTMLNDLSLLYVQENGKVIAPGLPMPQRDLLIKYGLYKVADLVPEASREVVHNNDSFSVNSTRIRTFKKRADAENWLNVE